MHTYEVVIRNEFGGRDKVTVTAENVHVVAQGHVKFLNGKGRDAQLVSFYNTQDVVSVTVKGV